MLQFRHDSDDSNKKYADEDKEWEKRRCKQYYQREKYGCDFNNMHPDGLKQFNLVRFGLERVVTIGNIN